MPIQKKIPSLEEVKALISEADFESSLTGYIKSGTNNISAGEEVILRQTGPIGWDALQIKSTTDDEVGISFHNEAANKKIALGIPQSSQLPGYKLSIYDGSNSYGYGTTWMALATENWVNDQINSMIATDDEIKQLLGIS